MARLTKAEREAAIDSTFQDGTVSNKITAAELRDFFKTDFEQNTSVMGYGFLIGSDPNNNVPIAVSTTPTVIPFASSTPLGGGNPNTGAFIEATPIDDDNIVEITGSLTDDWLQVHTTGTYEVTGYFLGSSSVNNTELEIDVYKESADGLTETSYGFRASANQVSSTKITTLTIPNFWVDLAVGEKVFLKIVADGNTNVTMLKCMIALRLIQAT